MALLGDAAHLMLQYMAQGAAMAMEDAVCLGVCCRRAPAATSRRRSRDYQKMRLVRASRVQISANSLVGMIFHVPDGLERLVRNDIYRGRSPERYYDALEWVFSAPDYVQEFRRASRSGPISRDRAHAAKLHRALQLARQDLERAPRARLAARHRAEERRAAGEHAVRAERARFQDVDAAAHAAVEQHGDREPTARRNAGNASSVAAAPSSWRPPWLETTTPSQPIGRGALGVVGRARRPSAAACAATARAGA